MGSSKGRTFRVAVKAFTGSGVALSANGDVESHQGMIPLVAKRNLWEIEPSAAVMTSTNILLISLWFQLLVSSFIVKLH